MQTDFPWHVSPIRLIPGPVPGTHVKVDPKCEGRSAASVVKPGEQSNWCCENCSHPIHFQVGPALYYPMEIQKAVTITDSNPKVSKLKLTETHLSDNPEPTVAERLKMWRTGAHASQPSGTVFRGLGVETRKGYLEDHIVNFLGLMLCLQAISNSRPRQRPLAYWVLSWLAFAVFGLPSVFSCVGFGSWLVLLHASTSSIRVSQMMIPLWMLLHVGQVSNPNTLQSVLQQTIEELEEPKLHI